MDARDLPKITRILDRLDVMTDIKDMNIPGWDFHELKGTRKGVYWFSRNRTLASKLKRQNYCKNFPFQFESRITFTAPANLT